MPAPKPKAKQAPAMAAPVAPAPAPAPPPPREPKAKARPPATSEAGAGAATTASAAEASSRPPSSSRAPAAVPPSLARYKSPDWALPEDGTPAFSETPWTLEVLKNGVPVSTVPLHEKARCVVGRQDDVCDLVLEHPSISRAHAVMQHGADGRVWMCDLGSTHGTKINKRKLAGMSFEQMRPGDVMKFGESTRLFIVHGPVNQQPQEEESEKLREAREKIAERNAKNEVKLKKANMGHGATAVQAIFAEKEAELAKQGGGVSWGMDEDAPDEESVGGELGVAEEELPEYLKGKKAVKEHKSSLDAREVDSKDEKLWAKLQQKVAKANNIQVSTAAAQERLPSGPSTPATDEPN